MNDYTDYPQSQYEEKPRKRARLKQLNKWNRKRMKRFVVKPAAK